VTMSSRSKFTELIAVRFTPEELARLQESAGDRGIGASTLVRILVNQALKPTGPKPRKMTIDEFREVMASTLNRLDKSKTESFLKEISVGNPDDPALLVWAGQTQKWEEYTSLFLKALLAALGIEVSFPENKNPAADNSDSNENVFQVKNEDEIEPLKQTALNK
jgi:hypothetical protein